MNPKFLLVCCCLLGIARLSAAPVTGDSLNVTGSGSPNTPNTVSPGKFSGAFGTWNTVTGMNSLAVGMNSSIAGNSNLNVGNYNNFGSNVGNSMAIGYANGYLGSSYYWSSPASINSGSSSLLVGSFNAPDGWFPCESLFVGSINLQNGYGCSDTLVSGVGNILGGEVDVLESSLVVGSSNFIANGKKYVIGVGLITESYDSHGSQTLLGQFNALPATADQLLVVGNGVQAPDPYGEGLIITRRNALEIYTDGRIRIPKRQGDISMGEFGNGTD